jgi:hypothetical protein
MRHIRMACGLAAAVGALCVAAVPALADSKYFVASIPGKTISPEKPAKAEGKTEEPQVFKFGSTSPTYIIKCQQSPFPENRAVGKTALTKATITEGQSTELEVSTTFQKCGRYATMSTQEFTPATIKGKLTVIYHVNGFGEVVGNEGGEELEYGKEPHVEVLETAVSIKVAPAKQCTIIVPAQTVPVKAIKKPDEEFSSAVYSNVFVPTTKKGFGPEGRETLVIANEFKNMKFRFAEETQCGVDQPKEQGTEGSYKGTLNLGIPSGNLGIEEKIEA